MQAKLAKLAKLPTERIDVNHQGPLDNTSADVLLEMKREIEVWRAKQKKLLEARVVNRKRIPRQAPALESQIGSHFVAVVSSQGPDNSKIAD